VNISVYCVWLKSSSGDSREASDGIKNQDQYRHSRINQANPRMTQR